MADRDFPDGRMQKLMGKSWTSWNLPEQPTDLDLRKLKDVYQPPEPYRSDDHQSTPIPSKFLPLFGTHPDSDFLSITKCPACGWLLKVQHANKHFLRDSRGAIVCKDSDLAIFGSKVLGRAVHPVGELKETWSRRVTLRLLPPAHSLPSKPLHTHTLRGTPSITDLVSKSRHGSGSHSNKTEYLSTSHSQYRYRSHSQQLHVPTPYMSKNRSGGSGSSLTTLGVSPTGKNKSVKSHTTTSPTGFSTTTSSLRHSLSSNTKSGNHKSHGTSGSYTLSIPSEDMGQNESVEDLLMSNTTQSYPSSKHVHIIATQNSKSKSTDTSFDHHKYYPEVPEKRIKLDTHSRSDHHYHKSSHGHSDSHDAYSKSKSRHSSSQTVYNGMTSDSTKKKSSSSSSSLYSKSDSSSPNKHHHLRSTTHSSIVTMSKPVVSMSSLSSQTRAHSIGSFSSSSSSVSERDRTKTSPSKKKKRKRDKDEPRKIIPLKDRDFNPDKHCGVVLPGSTSPCKRSLTCKTHSIASRRAVHGRSKSFDALLAAHKMAKTEEKVPPPPPPPTKREVVVEEVPKPKKKKLSGTSSTSSAPNDLGNLANDRLGTTYARTRTPDVEVLVVKPKPKPPPPPQYDMLHCYSKKFKNCPLVYPYLPETQAKFEAVWYNPATMERNTNSAEERHKFVFLLKHYKNPFYLNCDIKPLAKNAREKRNVFSIWNASEKQVGTQHTVNWTSMDTSRRHNSEPEDLQFICLVNKK